jgi:hypothetical protein
MKSTVLFLSLICLLGLVSNARAAEESKKNVRRELAVETKEKVKLSHLEELREKLHGYKGSHRL